MNTTPTKIIRV